MVEKHTHTQPFQSKFGGWAVDTDGGGEKSIPIWNFYLVGREEFSISIEREGWLCVEME